MTENNFILAAIAASFLLAVAGSANAQQPSWNEAQSEVWALVEQSWVDTVAENGKWPADYIHDKFVGWGDDSAAPRYKDAAIAWGRFNDENSQTLMYEVSPAAIIVEKNTAVVHYSITTVTEDHSGKRTRSVGRLTEVLVRDGGTWKWLTSVDFEPKLSD